VLLIMAVTSSWVNILGSSVFFLGLGISQKNRSLPSTCSK
jgi:hypothetical protein